MQQCHNIQSLTCLKLNTPVFALRDAMSFSSISSGTALESVNRQKKTNQKKNSYAFWEKTKGSCKLRVDAGGED